MIKKYSGACALLLTASLLFNACSLVDVTNIKPVNQISDTEITDIPTAEKMLAGTYGMLNGGLDFLVTIPGYTSLMGISVSTTSTGASSETYFANNSIPVDDNNVKNMYTAPYRMLNAANHVIEKTERLKVDAPRKMGIVAEAKFLRALDHFYLLRLFGQFYDLNSKYGIVLRSKPVEDISASPRSSVKESYDLILADLDYAITNAPDFKSGIYVSKALAKAYKAKVLLYRAAAGDHAEAARLAKTVLDEAAPGAGHFSLEKEYKDIFIKKFTSTEPLFVVPFNEKSERNNKGYSFRQLGIASTYLKDAYTTGDKRAATIPKFVGGMTIGGQTLNADTEYFMRLDEVYLIYAEATLRSSGNLLDAQNAINVIRKRAGIDDTTLTSVPQGLAEVRLQKLLELGAESGEDWFDLVRYAVAGDINISQYKPNIKSSNQYSLPIPFESVRASKYVVIQNPGY